MRVHFVDVGQGTCQIILLGGQNAIVVDAGSAPGTALRLLKLHKVTRIEQLVISHSHLDHSGGAAKRSRIRDGAVSGILAEYQSSIGTIWHVWDHKFRSTTLAAYLAKLMKEGKIRSEQVQSLSVAKDPQELWSSVDQHTKLVAIAPTGGQALLATMASNPNAASAILELRHRGQRIVFTADSEFSQWRDVYRLRGNTRHTCRVMTMPHHGGLMNGSDADLAWFCTVATAADVVVLSVATVNQHDHPREAVVRNLASTGCHVMCTQITNQCCNALENARPGVIGPPLAPCRSSSKRQLTSRAKRSKNVACAGTIVAILDDNGITIEREADHVTGVDSLVSSGHSPLCRPSQVKDTEEDVVREL